MDAQELAAHLRYTLGASGHGLYKRGLQVPETTCLGWLLYSTNEMNKDEIAQQLTLYLGTPVDVRWRAIYTGSGFKRGTPTDDGPVRALHIEVSSDSAKVSRPLLRKMYGTTPDPQVQPVLGIRMRLTPEVNRLTNLSSVAKATRLRRRQQAWCHHVVRISSWKISQLDFVDSELNCSLRQILMSLRSTEPGFEHLKLFFAVEHRYWSQEGGFVFLVVPSFADEARMTVAGLLPYLKYLATTKQQAPERIEGFFTPEAVDRLAGAYYDPARGEVVSEEEDLLDAIEQCSEDMLFDLTQLITDQAPPPTTATEAPTLSATSSRPLLLSLLSAIYSAVPIRSQLSTLALLPKKPPLSPRQLGKNQIVASPTARVLQMTQSSPLTIDPKLSPSRTPIAKLSWK